MTRRSPSHASAFMKKKSENQRRKQWRIGLPVLPSADSESVSRKISKEILWHEMKNKRNLDERKRK